MQYRIQTNERANVAEQIAEAFRSMVSALTLGELDAVERDISFFERTGVLRGRALAMVRSVQAPARPEETQDRVQIRAA